MEILEYPKWIYPAGIKEAYEEGEEPYLVEEPEEESAPPPKKRGRPAKVVEAE
jgi:hypothetical protein